MLILYPDAVIRRLAKPNPVTGASVLHAGMGEGGMTLALSRYLKQYPYMSQWKGRGALVNTNNTVVFNDLPNTSIFCRHMALHWVRLRQQHLHQKKQAAVEGLPRPEFRYEHFQTPEALKANLPASLEEEFDRIVACTRENHLIDNSRFGNFLERQFVELAGSGASAKHMLIESTNHTLQVKTREDGTRAFVANFADPNESNNNFHVERDRPEDFRDLAMDTMTTRPDKLQPGGRYHFERFPVSMVQVIEGDALSDASPARGRRCTLDETIPLRGTILSHWLRGGFDGNLRDVEVRLAEFEHQVPFDSALFELLSAHNNNNKIPGLYLAAQDGRAEAIAAYADLVLKSHLSEDEKIALLEGKNPKDGGSTLGIAMQQRDGKGVLAYVHAILGSGLPDSRQEELLTATTHAGRPRHWHSLAIGAAGMAKLYCDAILASGLSSAVKKRLLVAECRDGVTALQKGVQKKQTEAVQIQCAALLALPDTTDEEKAYLIAGAGTYQLAMQQGDIATAQVIKSALDGLVIQQAEG